MWVERCVRGEGRSSRTKRIGGAAFVGKMVDRKVIREAKNMVEVLKD